MRLLGASFNIMNDNLINYKQGLIDGISVALGYFAVSFTLGISASKIGIKWYQSALMSALNYTSAGQAAALNIMAEGGSIYVLSFSTLVINLRYLLMSAALAVKLSPKTSRRKRMLMAIGVTDEIFGLASTRNYPLNPMYNVGAMTLACPGWVIGTSLGGIMGEILPPVLTSALSLALYAMFIAIIIPPAVENKVIALTVISSMLLSFLFTKLKSLSFISSGMKVIIITLLCASIAAFFFPIEELKLEEEYDE